MNSFVWWTTVFIYWAVVGLCIAAFRAERIGRAWGILAAAFAILAANKQHNLAGALTRLLRRAAVHDHWYGDRRFFQKIVLCGLIVFIFTLLLGLERWARRARWTVYQRAVLGIAISLLGFATARSVSLHAIDSLLYRDLGGVKLNWVFELGGLLFGAGFIVTSIVHSRSNGREKHYGQEDFLA